MRGKRIWIIIGVLVWAVLCIPQYEDVASYVWNAAERPVVVLDAGHGGIDGGAEGAGGIVEKDINLRIAKALKEKLEVENILVVMTREDDNGLYGASQEGAIRTLKTIDMHERKRIIEETDADLTVSIHLNSFTQDTSVKGAQVFYPASSERTLLEESERAAELIQEALNGRVNGGKPRIAMGKDDVFLLRDATCPIVIAECGFLSNAEELAKLKTKKQQTEIAEALKEGICKTLENDSENMENGEEKNNKR